MTTTTVGQILINEALPEEMRDYSRVLDKKGLKKLLREVMQQHPDKYSDIVHRLGQIGADSAYYTGSSFSLADLKSSQAKQRIVKELDERVNRIASDKRMSDDKKNALIVETLSSRMDELRDETHAEGIEAGNQFSEAIVSGARGNTANLSSLRGADLLLLDHKDRPIPIPILHNYSEGLSAPEYFAGAYGTRKGVVTMKRATADAGFLGKQLAAATGTLVVTDDEPIEGTGYPVRTDDEDNEGAVLARDYADYPAGTVITPSIQRALKRKHSEILIHSPIASGGRGVPRLAAGVRERGGFSPIGDPIGIAASQALCLVEGTLVRMADGSQRAIETIEVGDVVLGCSAAGVVVPTRVLGATFSGNKECVRVIFRRGVGTTKRDNILVVEATSDHKILSEIVVRGSMAAARRLSYFNPVSIRPLHTEIKNKQDRFCAKLAHDYDDTNHFSEAWALILGLLVGDGSYTTSRALQFSCYDALLIKHIRPYMRSIGFKLLNTGEGAFVITDEEHRVCKRRDDGSIYRNRLIEYLRVNGMIGQAAKDKIAPPAIFSWDNKSIANFISGFIAADGWVTTKDGFVGFSSNSYRLLHTLRALLSIRFGIWSSSILPYNKLRASGKFYDHKYKMSICRREDITKLSKVMSIPGVKRARLNKAGKKRVKGTSRVHGRCSLISRESIGVRPTYDLYVAHPDHLFLLANGLVVSNSEPISQSQLSAKHSAGVIGAAHETGVSGFQAINQLVQIPKSFRNAATLSTLDGHVSRIEDAPQGGQFVWVGKEQHYVHPSIDLRVKVGDTVEAGDVLSEGVPNPSEIVRYKHVGEGRRYFVEVLRRTLNDNGIGINRRNLELIARGLVNHVRVVEADEIEGALPDDILPYDELASRYKPRFGNFDSAPNLARNRYLERPALHYSIGTKLTPSVISTMKRHKVGSVTVHNDPPPFEPHMVRAMETTMHDPDFFRRLQGFYIGKGFMDAVQRGGQSEVHGLNWGHSLAEAKDFGKDLKTKGVF